MGIDFAAIREQFPLVDQLARYGFKVGRDLKFRCPIPGHRDKTPSANIIRGDGFADRWWCHVCEKGGDVVDLESEVHGIADRGDAARHLWGPGELPQLRDMGKRSEPAPNRPEAKREKLGLVFTLGPVPADAPPIRPGAETPPILSKHNQSSTCVPADVYGYYSLANEKVGLVLRIEQLDGSKKTLPVRWEINLKRWVWAGWAGDDVAPLYNAPAVARRQDATVIMVEGEKCARLAKELLVDYVATCWAGGTGGIRKADLSLLKGRTVIFWPDNDEIGLKAMRTAAEKAFAARSLWVEPSPDWPEGHDIADILKEEGGVQAALDRLKSAEPFAPGKPEPELPRPGSWLLMSQGGWVPEDAYIDLTKESKLNVRSEINGWTGISHHPFFAALQWDVVRRQVMLGDRDINPGADYNFLQAELARHTQVRLPIAQLAKHVVNRAMLVPINPLADKLRALTWDGVKRPLWRYAGAKENVWTLAAFERWFLGLIGRILNPGLKHDIMLVLEGDQGLGKSAFFEVLAQPCGYDGFGELLRLTGLDDASMMKIDGKLIVEMSEMGAYRKADSNAFKAILVSRVDEYRRPYAEEYVKVPRTCVFAGSLNPTGQYLTDTSGNRRIAPVKVVGRPLLDELRADLDQIYAEGIVRYTALLKAGGPVNWFTDDELELQKLATGKREVSAVFSDRLDLELSTHPGDSISQDMVWGWTGVATLRDRRTFSQELQAEMRRYGWELSRKRPDRRWLWRRLKAP
jgi:putative DNA primase/helicase